MPKIAIREIRVLCKIRHGKKQSLEFVTIKVIRTKPRKNRKQKDTYSVLYDMGKNYRLPQRITRDIGPYDSVSLAMYYGLEKLVPFMKNVAELEYSFEDGVIVVGVVQTGDGFIAVASISDRTVHWTEERTLSAETIFEMEEYLFRSFAHIEKIDHA